MHILNYKEYVASFEYDDEGEVYHGEVLGLDDMLTFQGDTIQELEKAFQDTVNDYINWCKEIEENPQFSGIFVHPLLRHKMSDFDIE